jgi:D-sedoheptulose 7-phosphate isomerase
MSKRLGKICEALSLLNISELERAVQLLKEARARGSFVWIIGNGGSAATSAHFANDLLKMCHIRAVDVSGMTPTTLAFGNDHGWERMFANALLPLISPNDVLVAISCGGNSPNILAAVDAFGNHGKIIAITGPDGKLSKKDVDACLSVRADDITVQEDVHLILCHEIAWMLTNEDVD